MRVPLVVPALSMLLAATGCPVVDQASAAVPTVTTATTVTTSAAAAPAAPGTNVIVVIVDDANDVSCKRLQAFLPKTSRVLRDRGTCFENATTNSPLCAPSRASLQTGQLGHNSGVARQQDARRLRIQDTIQGDLGAAGWATYGTGKFFNGISPWTFESGARSSGFQRSDFWSSSRYYDYDLWDDQTQTHHRPPDRVHATTRVGMFLRSFIADNQGSGRPFYAYAAFKAPHTDNSARTERQRLPLPTPANAQRRVPRFDYSPEADRRDKLPIFRTKLSSRASLKRLYTARTRAMYDVDDEMGKTFDLLRSEGILDTTAIFFTSDHGYHLGENGWETKGDPYPTATDVPLLAYLPGTFRAGATVNRPVSLVDVAPTIHDLAGVAPQHRVDGRSLLSRHTRRGTFFELRSERTAEDSRTSSRTGRSRRGTFAPGQVPSWAMYREGKRFLVEYYRPDGRVLAREFYADAGARRNLLWKGFRTQPPARLVARFEHRLQRGRTCAGTGGPDSRNPCP